MDFDFCFMWFGKGVAALIAVGVVCLAVIALCVFVSVFWPRFHFGAPRASIVLRSYGKCQIITGKDPDTKTKPEPQLIQELELSSWFGLSSRSSANWFIGLMRWHQMPH